MTADDPDDLVQARFFSAEGRLMDLPRKHAKLLAVLDRVAQAFEPGQTYYETQVDAILKGFHDDHAALRRYLVENDFLTREENWYWRSGGTFDV